MLSVRVKPVALALTLIIILFAAPLVAAPLPGCDQRIPELCPPLRQADLEVDEAIRKKNAELENGGVQTAEEARPIVPAVRRSESRSRRTPADRRREVTTARRTSAPTVRVAERRAATKPRPQLSKSPKSVPPPQIDAADDPAAAATEADDASPVESVTVASADDMTGLSYPESAAEAPYPPDLQREAVVLPMPPASPAPPIPAIVASADEAPSRNAVFAAAFPGTRNASFFSSQAMLSAIGLALVLAGAMGGVALTRRRRARIIIEAASDAR